MVDPTPDEVSAMAVLDYYVSTDSGYAKIQATRPQTIGYGLVDSPAGLATWILEKFWSWTDRDRHPEESFTRDELLDNISIYWFTASAASSARIYWESFGASRPGTVDIPAGCSLFPHDILGTSKRWAERKFTDIRYWNVLDRGGHFAAFEQPELFVSEVRAAFRALL
jgi:pimeloyl-ACP methyl ester carboxylesterase